MFEGLSDRFLGFCKKIIHLFLSLIFDQNLATKLSEFAAAAMLDVTGQEFDVRGQFYSGSAAIIQFRLHCNIGAACRNRSRAFYRIQRLGRYD